MSTTVKNLASTEGGFIKFNSNKMVNKSYAIKILLLFLGFVTIAVSVMLGLLLREKHSNPDTVATNVVIPTEFNFSTQGMPTAIEYLNAEKYYIQGKVGLDNFAQCVNNGRSFLGKYIYLESDIDYEYGEFAGVGCNLISGGSQYAFAGHFFGQGHTISNYFLKLNTYGDDKYGYKPNATLDEKSSLDSFYCVCMGFFASLKEEAYVSDLEIKNVAYLVPGWVFKHPYKLAIGGIAGHVMGFAGNRVKVDRCAIEGMYVNNSSTNRGEEYELYCGGLIGKIEYDDGEKVQGDISITDCFVRNLGWTLKDKYMGFGREVMYFPGAFIGLDAGKVVYIIESVFDGTNSFCTSTSQQFDCGAYPEYYVSKFTVHLIYTKEAIPETFDLYTDVSSKKGRNAGTSWYFDEKNGGYNGGFPKLRWFIDWVELKFLPGDESIKSISPESFYVPSDAEFESIKGEATETIFGEDVTATPNPGYEITSYLWLFKKKADGYKYYVSTNHDAPFVYLSFSNRIKARGILCEGEWIHERDTEGRWEQFQGWELIGENDFNSVSDEKVFEVQNGDLIKIKTITYGKKTETLDIANSSTTAQVNIFKSVKFEFDYIDEYGDCGSIKITFYLPDELEKEYALYCGYVENNNFREPINVNNGDFKLTTNWSTQKGGYSIELGIVKKTYNITIN